MSRHLALFMHSLSIGGVPRRVASLAGGLARKRAAASTCWCSK